MKKIIFTSVIFLWFQILSATNVAIEINNSTKQSVTIMLGMVEGADALPRNYRPVFQLMAEGNDSKKTYSNPNIKKGVTIFIYAVLQKGGKTQPQEFKVNTKKTYSDKMEVLITQEDINSEESISDIMGKFKDFSKVRSGYHEVIDIGRDEAFKSVLGSMVLIDKDSNTIMKLTANMLKSNRADYKLTGQDFNIQKDFKKESITKLNGNIPLAADMSYMFGNSEISSFTWNVKNAGFIPWSHSEGKSEIQLFYNNIDTFTLNYLAQLYLRDTTVKMYFIDKAYLIESYLVSSKAFKKLTSDAEVNVTIYGSASSNYIRSSENLYETTKTNIVTDVWGSDHTDLLRQNAKRHLNELKKTVEAATDIEEVKPIYQEFKLYDKTLPELKGGGGNLKSIKEGLIMNIISLDGKINLQ